MSTTMLRFRWLPLVNLSLTILRMLVKFHLASRDKVFLDKFQSERHKNLLNSLASRNNSTYSINESSLKLYYVLFWSQSRFYPSPNDEYLKIGCPSLPCRLTDDRRLLPYSKAVVFRAPEFSTWDWPPRSSPDQSYVFTSWESPSTLSDFGSTLNSVSHEFNLTLTYRMDSDIPNPYGYLIPHSADPNEFRHSTRTVMNRKSKLAVWFVSHCRTKSEREKFVRDLQKYIPIDVYGDCGPLKCEKWTQDCDEYRIISEYKFYISFENSLCKDYVTEKFYQRLNHDVVPVVLGGAGNFMDSNRDQFPEHGFIVATNFGTIKLLADYLLYLDAHPDEYAKYFHWKMRYKAIFHFPFKKMLEKAYCDLCRKLMWIWEDFPKRRQHYENISYWWHDKYPCDDRSVHRFLNGV